MRVISVIGYKKSGKTALVEELVAALRKHGTVGTIKHMHEHYLDREGTDTWKHMQAGAEVVIAVTPGELVRITRDNNLKQALDGLADSGVEFCVVEGFKDSELPKIALGEVEASNILVRLQDQEKKDIEKIVNIILDRPEYHTLGSLVRLVKSDPAIEKAGAIGTFTGIVRKVTGDTITEKLEFEEYSGIARQKMDEICADLKEKEGIVDIRMHHRTGIIFSGEDIVYIVVAAGHRQQLFPVLSEAIERLKEEVPIWKKEHTLKGDWWVHDRN